MLFHGEHTDTILLRVGITAISVFYPIVYYDKYPKCKCGMQMFNNTEITGLRIDSYWVLCGVYTDLYNGTD